MQKPGLRHDPSIKAFTWEEGVAGVAAGEEEEHVAESKRSHALGQGSSTIQRALHCALHIIQA